ncbi:NACHT, LRR and PYD domains-containing protein 1b allele 2-like [Anarrhichthys ocellatus]|uniref:NACHT, LRR and PYD domains-containing protein 1b allele 2-like n=1 Tax=Anarrhichthys ocellatus TaxID=433405 RepID=UPI0012EE705B|nr:NACHT, LRR and PYD domains-containing protein 1b allele 2-like [Anarrhichthys ocellatus]
MERIKSMQYMPAGPLMNITVLAGKLDEVHLPHWICIDDNPTILDKFAVLHIDDCGDNVEKVSEVTSSHVKLCEPVFSLKMILVRVGLSVEIYCNVLIYKTNKTFLTLHAYLIPRDPGLEQVIFISYFQYQ